jgi:hypothetical protein
MGILFEQKENWGQAEKIYLSHIKNKPNDNAVLSRLVQVQFNQEKMLEVIQNDPVLSQADYIVGNNNSIQSLKAKDKIFGKPEMAGKGYSFAGSKIKLINLEKQKKDLEENIKTLSPEDQIKTQQEINNINDQISPIM